MSFVSEFCCQNWRRQSKPLTCVLLFSVLLIFFIFLFTSVSKTRNLQLQPCHYLVNLTRTPQKLWRPWRTTSPSWSSRTRRQRRYEFESSPWGYYSWFTLADKTFFTIEIISGNCKHGKKKCAEHYWWGENAILQHSGILYRDCTASLCYFSNLNLPQTRRVYTEKSLAQCCSSAFSAYLRWITGVFRLKNIAQMWHKGLVNLCLSFCVYLGPLVWLFFSPFFFHSCPRLLFNSSINPSCSRNSVDCIMNLAIEWWCSSFLDPSTAFPPRHITALLKHNISVIL